MQYVPPFPAPFVSELMLALAPFLFLALLWTIVLKGFALWHAARSGQKWWFIALLIINTLGVLEAFYLIWFRPSSTHYHRSHKSETPAHESSSAQA